MSAPDTVDNSQAMFPHFTPQSLDEHADCARAGALEEYINVDPPYRFIRLGAHSVELEHNSVVEAIAAKLDQLEAGNKFICQSGRLPNTRDGRREYEERKRNGHLFDVRAVQLALDDIPHLYAPRLTPQLRAEGKHWRQSGTDREYKELLEYWRGEQVPEREYYIVAGDFAMAMLLLGYPFKQSQRAYGKNRLTFRAVNIGVRVDTHGYRQGVYEGGNVRAESEET